MSDSSLEQPKSQELFILDNLQTWPEHARKSGDMVFWADNNPYPTAVPIASIQHPSVNGRVVAMAGPLSLIFAVVHGAKDGNDVAKAMGGLPKNANENPNLRRDARFRVEQFRVPIETLLNRLLIALYGEQEGAARSDMTTAKLLKVMAQVAPTDAALIAKALTHVTSADAASTGLSPQEWEEADDLRSSLNASIEATKG